MEEVTNPKLQSPRLSLSEQRQDSYYRARYYDPTAGRFISGDPIGFNRGEVNLYAYVRNNPTIRVDRFGLDWQDDWLKNASDFSAGAGSALTFGLTDLFNDDVVDKCSGWHKFGTVTGIALTTAIGGAAGAEAAEANAGKEGFEFSHWIPKRSGGPRSTWNGNFVSEKFHYLTDDSRFPAPAGSLQRWGPKLPHPIQQILRIPWVYDGAGAGAAYGVAGAKKSAKSCECQ